MVRPGSNQCKINMRTSTSCASAHQCCGSYRLFSRFGATKILWILKRIWIRREIFYFKKFMNICFHNYYRNCTTVNKCFDKIYTVYCMPFLFTYNIYNRWFQGSIYFLKIIFPTLFKLYIFSPFRDIMRDVKFDVVIP
jgi:hypothetical protein